MVRVEPSAGNVPGQGRRDIDSPLLGQPYSLFTTTLDFGTPAQTLNVAIDTGSSNLIVAARQFEDVANFYSVDASTTGSESTSRDPTEYL